MTDGRDRTYSIWGFAALFVVVAALGLGVVLLVGTGGTSSTRQLDVRQTTSTSAPPTTATPGPAATVPGGAPAPEGVQSVVVDGGTTSYAFAVPEVLASVPLETVVPPTQAEPVDGGSALRITVSCAVGAGEALAQLTVTGTDTSVTVLAVTIGPAGAPTCGPAEAPRTVTVPLAEPLGSRQVVVVPAGTTVPTPVPG